MREENELLPGFSFEVGESTSTLLATWALLLQRSTRAENVSIHLLLQDKVLLVDLEMAENIKFSEYAKKVADGILKAKHLVKIDSSAVMKGLRGMKSITTPIFTVGFSSEGVSKNGCDLVLRVSRSQAEVFYCPRLLERDSIQLLGERFRALLDSVNQWPNVEIGSLPMMNVDQENTILCEWNNTDHKWPEGYCIHHLFFEQVPAPYVYHYTYCFHIRKTHIFSKH